MSILEDGDLRQEPLYGVTDSARILRIPVATLRSWCIGREYPRAGEEDGFFEPLIERPDASKPELSFANLIEAHVLRALRVKHGIRMPKIRSALDYAESKAGIERLLLSDQLKAAAGALFVERYGQLINLSEKGQLGLHDVLKSHLSRIEFDTAGFPTSFYPLTRSDGLSSPKLIVINPRVSFGRATTESRGVSTDSIASRFEAGDSLDRLVTDYGLSEEEVEEAIRYELRIAA